MKNLITYGLLILLVGVILSACSTAPTPSASDIALQQTQQALYVCGTAVALDMPNPCQPTPTSTPIPPTFTPTPPPTPTATLVTGWVHYPESGGATVMPYGFEPNCGGAVGCPGSSYTYFINGVPQNGVPGGTTGTPGYWPWFLVGVPIALVIFGMLYLSAWGNTAPQRAIAKVTLLMGEAFASTLGSSGQPQLASPQAMTGMMQEPGIPVEFLATLLGQFMQSHEVPSEFKPEIGNQLKLYTKGQLVPLVTIQAMLLAFDNAHGSDVAKRVSKYIAHSIKRNERESR